MRKRVEQAALGVHALLCRRQASSLLDLRRPQDADGATPPSHEVEREFRYDGLE